MERRDFLKLASLTGLSVVAGGTYAGSSARADAQYGGPLYVFCHCGGGIDNTSLWDPKGDAPAPGFDTGLNKYPTSAIPSNGNIRWAPLGLSPDVMNANMQGGFTASDTFFNKYAPELTVINGIDQATNSHDAGTRTTWAGTLTEMKPTIAALIAASFLPTAPMGFITFGGYDTTDGVVGAARLGNIDALKRLAYPNKFDANNEDSAQFHLDGAEQALVDARTGRFNALKAKQKLPRIQGAMSKLYTSRLGSNELKLLTQYLPEKTDGGMLGQMQLAIAAYKAGIACSVNIERGGWDTHGDNDRSVAQNLQGNGTDGFLPQLDAIMTYAEEQGVRDNLVLMIGSDFGRTRGYNMGNGKDHWSVSSMAIMGRVGGNAIPGNRTLGGTTPDHNPLLVDPSTMQESANGVRITSAHFNRALRKFAGIFDSPISAQFPVEAKEDMPFFG